MSNPQVIFKNVSNVHGSIHTTPDILHSLCEFFSYFAPGYRFHPRFKNRVWNGKVSLIDRRKNTYNRGIYHYITQWLDTNGFTHEIVSDETPLPRYELSDIEAILPTIPIKNFETRDYQLTAILHCLNEGRATIESSVGSGKSFMMYAIARILSKKTMIIVPNVALSRQLASDMVTYGHDARKIGIIHAGQSKNVGEYDIVISTWQSAINIDNPEWFNQFEVVIGDECHKAKAKSLVDVISRFQNARYRFGFTGTLEKDKLLNLRTIEGLFGPEFKVTNIAKLIDEGHLSDLSVQAIQLHYPIELRKEYHRIKKEASTVNKSKPLGKRINEFAFERSFILNLDARKDFICKLVNNFVTNGLANVLVMIRSIEAHGIPLHEYMKQNLTDGVPLFYVDGNTDPIDREATRKAINGLRNSVTIASTGVYAEGINIPNVDKIILAEPVKSRIVTIQTIGRGLRKSETKDKCTIYDIVDDLSVGKKMNVSMKHYIERLKFYHEEKFRVVEHKVKINAV